jgi:hypothetical protein
MMSGSGALVVLMVVMMVIVCGGMMIGEGLVLGRMRGDRSDE